MEANQYKKCWDKHLDILDKCIQKNNITNDNIDVCYVIFKKKYQLCVHHSLYFNKMDNIKH